jgi:hypothetical protein
VKSEWSEQWERLAQRIKRVGYGCIYDLPIRDGEPDLSEPLRMKYTRLLKPGRTPNSKPDAKNVQIKEQYRVLLEECRRLQDIDISVLQIQDGLPSQMNIEKEEMI